MNRRGRRALIVDDDARAVDRLEVEAAESQIDATRCDESIVERERVELARPRPAEAAVSEATHELNNLITGIALLADHALESVSAEDPLCEDLRLICAGGERAAELIHELQRLLKGASNRTRRREAKPRS